MKRVLVVFEVLFLSLVATGARAQILLLQERDGSPARNLSAAEFAALADPLFALVLKDHVTTTDLSQIEALVQPKPEHRHVFVVDENIASKQRNEPRRAVLSFSGEHHGEPLTANIMLSVFFDSEEFPDTPSFIEAWGWDNHRSRYNFYRLDESGTPNRQMSWKFRGSSDGADLLSPSDRLGTCTACHINGAPIMKELSIPWNNWHSFKSQATVLLSSSNDHWPVSNSPRLKGVEQNGVRKGGLRGAEELEVDGIVPAIHQFNRRRINQALARRDSDGAILVDARKSKVVEAKRLLRPLFETTEYNIVSSNQKSGLHPFAGPGQDGPDEEIQFPKTLFLNANLIAGGTPAQFLGLKIQMAQAFQNLPKVKPDEYKRLAEESHIRLGGFPGDADFAWFLPEPSHIDNDLIDQLIRRGIVTPHFVAAVQSIELEVPILSKERAQLGQFVPNQFLFIPLDDDDDPFAASRHPDELTRSVIDSIAVTQPKAESAAARFLARLKQQDPIASLRNEIDAYHARIKARLENPSERQDELKRLFDKMIQARRMVLRDPVLKDINETGDRLFPIP